MEVESGNGAGHIMGSGFTGLDGKALFERIRKERILAFEEAITITEKHFSEIDNASGTARGGAGNPVTNKLRHRLAEIRAGKG